MRLLILLLSLTAAAALPAQSDTLSLENPSFESFPRHSRTPRGWTDCGFRGESPPDLHPSGEFGVTRPAADGGVYLGLVVRDNDTWEGVGQQLFQPLTAGQCYELNLLACRSPLYVSVSRMVDKTANYDRPAIIRLWGGQRSCDRRVLLAATPLPVESTEWEPQTLTFRAQKDLDFLILEAYYQPGTTTPYNGHVLIDRLSPLLPVDCE